MVKYIKQISIILGICLMAELLEYYISLPIAASIYGLILMLLALTTKLLPLEEVQDTADFLLSNIALLFIPPTVGMMNGVEIMKQMALPLLVICIVTTLLIMGVTGLVSQMILRKGKKEEA
ncbi:MAG: CidA/LrgA family protein [Lachnospiraceae bacterium]|nr:CidA/LrgA family protein [Lachnospiraceae bacterium]